MLRIAALLLLGGCTGLAGLDELSFEASGVGGGGATSTAGTGGAASGGGGSQGGSGGTGGSQALSCSDGPPSTFSANYGGSGYETLAGIAVDGDDNIVVAGNYNTSIDFGGGALTSDGGSLDNNVFVAKLDPSGAHLWSRGFGDIGEQTAECVTAANDGSVVIAGTFDGTMNFSGPSLSSVGKDTFIVKLDSSGGHVWSRQLGSAAAICSSLAVDETGDVYLTGMADGTLTLEVGSDVTTAGEDVLLLKLAGSDGAVLHGAIYGDSANQGGVAVAEQDGRVWLGAELRGGIDFGTGKLAAIGMVDMTLARFTTTGSNELAVQFGDPLDASSSARLRDIALRPDGQLLLFGEFNGTAAFGTATVNSSGSTDLFLAEVDSNGGGVWARSFPGPQQQQAKELAVTCDGNIAIAGRTSGNVNFGGAELVHAGSGDAYVAVLRPDGNHLSSAVFGDDQGQVVSGLAATRDGAIVVGGHFQGTMDFGGGTITHTPGSFDIFLAKIALP
jgi:hypothetical protein